VNKSAGIVVLFRTFVREKRAKTGGRWDAKLGSYCVPIPKKNQKWPEVRDELYFLTPEMGNLINFKNS